MKMKREDLMFIGWGAHIPTVADHIAPRCRKRRMDGYNESDYWDSDGKFKGPDSDGIVPVYLDHKGDRFPEYTWLFVLDPALQESEKEQGEWEPEDVWHCPKCGATREPTIDGGCTGCSKAEVDL